MDNTDRRLISILRANARLSDTEIAKITKLHRNTVRTRISRLEADGTLAGYTALCNMPGFKRFMLIGIESSSAKTRAKVERQLKASPVVSHFHLITGEWVFIVYIEHDHPDDFILFERSLSQIDGVSTRTLDIIRSSSLPKAQRA